MTTALAVIVRFLSLAAVYAAGMTLMSLGDDSGGADIGGGIAVLGALALVALAWGFVDGRREELGATIKRWSFVAVGWALTVSSLVAFLDGPINAEAINAAAFLAVFLGVEVFIAALVGAALGQSGRGRTMS